MVRPLQSKDLGFDSFIILNVTYRNIFLVDVVDVEIAFPTRKSISEWDFVIKNTFLKLQ